MIKEKLNCACDNDSFVITKQTNKNKPNSIWTAKCAKCGTKLDEFMSIQQIVDNIMGMRH